jgi:probable F420-dependent oxidoreductase
MKARFGVGLGIGRQLPDPAAFGSLVDGLEELRFDSLWLSERVAGPVLDPLSALAFAAGRSTRLKFGTSVLVVPGRHPVLLAKQLATIDAVSGGRLLPAFGLGTVNPAEQQAFGVARGDRAAWFDEAVPLMRRLWTEDAVSHTGPRFTVTDLSLWPKPVGRMEVWTGGKTPGEFDRTGRFAQGWLGGLQTPDEAGRARELIAAAAGRHGRTIDDDHYGTILRYARGPVGAKVLDQLAAARPDVADPAELLPVGDEQLIDLVRRFLGQGITKFVLVPAEGPADWSAELAWLSPLVRDFEAVEVA